MLVPVFTTATGVRPAAVFEIAAAAPDIDFQVVYQWVSECFEAADLYVPNPNMRSPAVGLRTFAKLDSARSQALLRDGDNNRNAAASAAALEAAAIAGDGSCRGGRAALELLQRQGSSAAAPPAAAANGNHQHHQQQELAAMQQRRSSSVADLTAAAGVANAAAPATAPMSSALTDFHAAAAATAAQQQQQQAAAAMLRRNSSVASLGGHAAAAATNGISPFQSLQQQPTGLPAELTPFGMIPRPPSSPEMAAAMTREMAAAMTQSPLSANSIGCLHRLNSHTNARGTTAAAATSGLVPSHCVMQQLRHQSSITAAAANAVAAANAATDRILHDDHDSEADGAEGHGLDNDDVDMDSIALFDSSDDHDFGCQEMELRGSGGGASMPANAVAGGGSGARGHRAASGVMEVDDDEDEYDDDDDEDEDDEESLSPGPDQRMAGGSSRRGRPSAAALAAADAAAARGGAGVAGRGRRAAAIASRHGGVDSDAQSKQKGGRGRAASAAGHHAGNGRKLRFEDLQSQFGCGLKAAARNLGVCPTTLKRACRREGIKRWPRRQLAKLSIALTSIQSGQADPAARASAAALLKEPGIMAAVVKAGSADIVAAATAFKQQHMGGSGSGGAARATRGGSRELPPAPTHGRSTRSARQAAAAAAAAPKVETADVESLDAAAVPRQAAPPQQGRRDLPRAPSMSALQRSASGIGWASGEAAGSGMVSQQAKHAAEPPVTVASIWAALKAESEDGSGAQGDLTNHGTARLQAAAAAAHQQALINLSGAKAAVLAAQRSDCGLISVGSRSAAAAAFGGSGSAVCAQPRLLDEFGHFSAAGFHDMLREDNNDFF